MKVSYIGLGVMGAGMALNLGNGEAEGLYEFLACDANEASLEQFKERGLKTSTIL
ncbi:NAD(P)-binding domain-containing protein [Sporosarcina thermotolerans]|nr:NAD(P)-binding domain-containing protein [Sporosarcina thermotolerans]WHT48178.1 NAD(P)-binding domain-containing protein [Sporosarcina thermotolerans]